MESQTTIKKHFATGIVLLTLLFSGISPLTLAKKNDVKKLITPTSVHAQLAFLASDALEGRFPGSRGGKAAGEYIIQHFREWQIKPFFHETYCQHFEIDHYHHPFRKGDQELPILKIRNIVGMIEGKNRDEYIIVGAHYDHLGVGTPVNGDSIYNGADDNASGTVAVLQLAKAFAAQKQQPQRTILFALWDGEEEGLLGSTNFVNSFADCSKIKAYVNFDMIGRNCLLTQPSYFVYFYTQAYPAFEKWMRNGVKKQALDLTPDYRAWDKPIGGSDNTPFAKKEVPIIWYHTDAQPDLHRPSDEVEKINIPKMTAIIQSAYYVVKQLSEAKTISAEKKE